MVDSSPRILWGTSLENVLDIGVFDNVRVFPREREGSAYERDGSGAPVSWREGWDFGLSGEARWIPRKADATSPEPRTAWSGPTGFEEFLKWARGGNQFRYQPDRSVADFYVDGCTLLEPAEAVDPDIEEADGSYRIGLSLVHATVDLGLIQRGLMFEYAPGASLTDPVAATFARATLEGYLNNVGQFGSSAINTLSDRHYPLGYTGGGVVPPKTALFQGSCTNKITAPENLSSWNLTGATVPSTNNPSPRQGDLTASFLRETAGGTIHAADFGYTIGATSKRGLFVFLKANGRTRGRVRITNPSGSECSVSYNLATGTIVSSIADFAKIFPLADGWFVIHAFGGAGGGTTSCSFAVVLQDNSGTESYSGDGVSGVYAWGCVATDNEIAGVYWGTGTSRNGDDLTFPFPFPMQDLFILAEFQRPDYADYAGDIGFARGLMQIGSGTPNIALVGIRGDARNAMIRVTTVAGTSTATVAVPGGQSMAYCAQVRNLRTAPEVALDVGSGPSAFGAGAGAMLVNPNQTITIGDAPYSGASSGTRQLQGGLTRIKVGPRIFAGVTRDTVAKGQAA
jgi:hypothetical protein